VVDVGLNKDVALCALRADIVPFAVKKLKAQPPFFNTKATKGAAMFAREPPNSYTPSL
jgi:hypothetical protein